MNETNITREIMLAIGKFCRNTRIFRNNVGMAWAGEATKKGSVIIIQNPRPLHAGLCEGSSDLIGWTSIEVTPDMIGKKVAIFTAIEVKVPGKNPTPEQANFIEQVRQAGGIAGAARSDSEARALLDQR